MQLNMNRLLILAVIIFYSIKVMKCAPKIVIRWNNTGQYFHSNESVPAESSEDPESAKSLNGKKLGLLAFEVSKQKFQ